MRIRQFALFLPVLLCVLRATAQVSPPDTPPSPDLVCSRSASYRATLNLSFTPASDPLIPGSDTAQIPIVLAVVHSPRLSLFRLSRRLNDSVAELVSKATSVDLSGVLDEHPLVESYVVLDNRAARNIPVDGVVSVTLRASSERNVLSVLVHLSPSPAWFAGLDSLPLCLSTDKPAFLRFNDSFALRNFNAGLDNGRSFQDDPNPYPDGETVAVSEIDVLQGVTLATVSLEKLPSPMIWWKIVIGVLSAIIALSIIAIIVVPRLVARRKNKGESKVPAARPQSTEW